MKLAVGMRLTLWILNYLALSKTQPYFFDSGSNSSCAQHKHDSNRSVSLIVPYLDKVKSDLQIKFAVELINKRCDILRSYNIWTYPATVELVSTNFVLITL